MRASLLDPDTGRCLDQLKSAQIKGGRRNFGRGHESHPTELGRGRLGGVFDRHNLERVVVEQQPKFAQNGGSREQTALNAPAAGAISWPAKPEACEQSASGIPPTF